MVNCASSELRGGTAEAEFSYPLVKTFNSDVFPQAPSPLYLIVPASVTQPRLPAVSEAVCLHCPPFCFNSGVSSGGQPTAIPACAGPFCFLRKAIKASCSTKILYGGSGRSSRELVALIESVRLCKVVVVDKMTMPEAIKRSILFGLRDGRTSSRFEWR